MSALIIIVILAIIATIITVLILRKLKGKLTIELPKTDYAQGEKLQGKITMLAKKSIESTKVTATLTCSVEKTSFDSEGDRETKRDILYQRKVGLAPAENYAAGTTKTFDFEFTIPAYQTFLHETKFSKFMDNVGKFLGPQKKFLREIEGRVDAKGLDLVGKKAISVMAGE